jgi:hypothetical protein
VAAVLNHLSLAEIEETQKRWIADSMVHPGASCFAAQRLTQALASSQQLKGIQWTGNGVKMVKTQDRASEAPD